MNTPVLQDTGRPHSVALPNMQELWRLLEQFNKAALARRFPGWDARSASAR